MRKPTLTLFALLALVAGCLADARTVDQICESWTKRHGEDPRCGQGVAAVEEAGGDAPCTAADREKVTEAGGLGAVIGTCFFQRFVKCQTDQGCLLPCMAAESPNKACVGCVGGPEVRACMVKRCNTKNSCANARGLGGGTENKCIGCAAANCVTEQVLACLPP